MASLVPVVGLIVAVTLLLRAEMHRTAEAEIGGVSKGVLSSLEGKLQTGLRLTSALARSSSITSGNYKGFASEARAIIASDPDVAWILLTDIKRRLFLFHSELDETPATTAPAGPNTMAQAEEVMRANRAVLFDLRVPRASSRIPVATIPIRTRVRGPAGEDLMITVMLKAQGFENLLRPAGLSPDWTLRILDAKGHLVASNRKDAIAIGQLLGAPTAECDGKPVFRNVGSGSDATTRGAENRYETLACSPAYGWSIRIEVPKNIQDAGGFRVLVLILIAGLLAACASFAVALGLARRLQGEQAMREDAETARRANLMKSEFLANVSHELRTPLNAILGHAQLLSSAPALPGGAVAPLSDDDHAGQIMRAGWYLLELIDDVIDMSKIESGAYKLETTPTNLVATMEDCLGQISEKALSLQVRLLPVRTSGTVEWVMADPLRLRQVMLNLLSNAIKYNVAGGTVEIRISEETDKRVRIAVIDTGRGISAANMNQLFQPFQRFKHKGDIIEGSGIGLSLSRRLLEFMGGAITAESREGKGSEFTITLQAAAAPNEITRTVPRPSSNPATTGTPIESRGRGIRILYVEDTLTNFEIVRLYLEKQPRMTIMHAETGSSGLERARREQPDVILLDMGLPDMHGMDVKASLAEDPLTRNIPVIALTAVALSHEIERAREAGFVDYVTKPVRLSRLKEIIYRVADDRDRTNVPQRNTT